MGLASKRLPRSDSFHDLFVCASSCKTSVLIFILVLYSRTIPIFIGLEAGGGGRGGTYRTQDPAVNFRVSPDSCCKMFPGDRRGCVGGGNKQASTSNPIQL